MRAWFWALLWALAGCSAEVSVDGSTASLLQAGELTERRAAWHAGAPRCGEFPSKEACEDGDTTLFNGLLCASGEPLGCRAVQRAQGADGRFWRSPRRVDGNLGQPKSFSRDM